MKFNTIAGSPFESILLYSTACDLACLNLCSWAGVWWTQKMSSVTSSQTRSRRRSVTGWLPPSRGRWGWCSGGRRRSHASAASYTQCRLGYLWKGGSLWWTFCSMKHEQNTKMPPTTLLCLSVFCDINTWLFYPKLHYTTIRAGFIIFHRVNLGSNIFYGSVPSLLMHELGLSFTQMSIH